MKKRQKFPESTSSVRQARHFVADSLTEVAPELSETAALLVSELATNAVVHAESDFEVVVVYTARSGRVRIEVSDCQKARPVPSKPPPHVPHGRGLLLVSTLADQWGVQEPRLRRGKAVWFELSPATTSATSPSTSAAANAATNSAGTGAGSGPGRSPAGAGARADVPRAISRRSSGGGPALSAASSRGPTRPPDAAAA